MSEIDRASTAVTAALASAAGVRRGSDSPIAPEDRPTASGHRFGPDLTCSECGVQWEAHQREPSPCVTDEPEDVFLKRPVIDEPGSEPSS